MADERIAGSVIAEKYRLLSLIGSGGFGTVWSAEQLETGRKVALKFLRAPEDESAARRFDIEATVLSRLNHPHCVQLIGHGEDRDGQRFVATEFLDGEALSAWIREPRPVPAVMELGAQIADALAHAHRLGIAHRDLKPDNVFVTTRDGLPHARVLDFGLAKLVGVKSNDITKSGEVIGSPGYMSPEQLRGRSDIGVATDLYCLGILLFELLEGRPIFIGDSHFAVSMKHLIEPTPELTVDVPDEVRALVRRLLSAEPSKRGTAANAALVLRNEPGRPAVAPPRAAGAVPRRTAQIAAAAVLLGFVIAAWVILRDTKAPPTPPTPFERIARVLAAPSPVPIDAAYPAHPTIAGPCAGKEHRPGRQLLEAWTGGGIQRSQVQVYVPDSPPSPEPYAAVLILHHGGSGNSSEILDRTGLEKIADERRMILVVPDDPQGLGRTLDGVWGSADSRAEAWSALEIARDQLCIDPDRIHAFGHGSGGVGVEKLACDHPGIASIATSAARRELGSTPCRSGSQPPYLFLAATRDRVEGTPQCPTVIADVEWTLQRHESMLRENAGCTGEPKRTRHGTSECLTWSCDTDLVVCHLDGGPHWPGWPTDECAGEAADFDYGNAIADFFEAHPLNYRSAPTDR